MLAFPPASLAFVDELSLVAVFELPDALVLASLSVLVESPPVVVPPVEPDPEASLALVEVLVLALTDSDVLRLSLVLTEPEVLKLSLVLIDPEVLRLSLVLTEPEVLKLSLALTDSDVLVL